MTIESVPVGTLIEDFSIYPRHAVDSSHVAALAEALRIGQTLPPPIVEKTSKRYVDGWHRGRAFERVYGPDAPIQVDMRTYKSHADLVRAAVDANMTHGRRLDRVDRVRCAVLLREVGLEPAQIALTLRVRESVLESLQLRIAAVPAGATGSIPGTNDLPLKRSAAHLAGKSMTGAQATAHAGLPGTSLTLVAKQLTSALRAGLVDPTNDRLHAALMDLRAVLDAYLDKREVPA